LCFLYLSRCSLLGCCCSAAGTWNFSRVSQQVPLNCAPLNSVRLDDTQPGWLIRVRGHAQNRRPSLPPPPSSPSPQLLSPTPLSLNFGLEFPLPLFGSSLLYNSSFLLIQISRLIRNVLPFPLPSFASSGRDPNRQDPDLLQSRRILHSIVRECLPRSP
jgi:hypothetical protein